VNNRVFKIFRDGKLFDGRHFTSKRGASLCIAQAYKSAQYWGQLSHDDIGTKEEFKKDFEIVEYEFKETEVKRYKA